MQKIPELTEMARWHLLRWSGGRSRFDPDTSQSGARVSVYAARKLPIGERGAPDNSNAAGLSIDSPATCLRATTDERYRNA